MAPESNSRHEAAYHVNRVVGTMQYPRVIASAGLDHTYRRTGMTQYGFSPHQEGVNMFGSFFSNYNFMIFSYSEILDHEQKMTPQIHTCVFVCFTMKPVVLNLFSHFYLLL